MRSTLRVLLGLVLVVWVGVASAAPPKDKDDAPEVVTGTLQQLTCSVDRYEDGRVVTKYVAVLKVEKVERTTTDNNRVVKDGDVLTLRWSHLTWRDGTSGGHTYSVHEKDVVRAWLARHCGPGNIFYPIDNASALEKISGQKP
ncbi:MAG TPA: hypothetical protein VKE74_02410 [Gemmataceae bacterium]|nr:hypothetical protein [Gemmataceae bacterium]